jgi:hypothetical protein
MFNTDTNRAEDVSHAMAQEILRQMMLEKRLSKLEPSVLPKNGRQWRRMIGTAAECEMATRALIDAGQAQESDGFIFRIVVAPGEATRPS